MKMVVIDTTKKEWFPDLDSAIEYREIPSFLTSKMARETAMKYGWGNKIIKLERRFERIYIVGVIDFQPEIENDIQFEVMRVPMLKYETKNGIQYQPVVKFRKPYGS